MSSFASDFQFVLQTKQLSKKLFTGLQMLLLTYQPIITAMTYCPHGRAIISGKKAGNKMLKQGPF